MNTPVRIQFDGRILLLGCGSVSQCLQPLLLRHLDMDFTRLTVLDFEDLAGQVPATTDAGARYVRDRVTPDNLAELLGQHIGAGDLLINLSWSIETVEIVEWCQEHGVRYVDTSVEEWDPSVPEEQRPPQDRTMAALHARLKRRSAQWPKNGPTAVVEHGANPGLVSHWVKVALEDLTLELLKGQGSSARTLDGDRRDRLEAALGEGDHARLARETGTKVIHVSERDTQIGESPKKVGEFVNTWSVHGFHDEGSKCAEMGWGTHEPALPELGSAHPDLANGVYLAKPGMDTLVRSWVPSGGPIIGMVIQHGESLSINDNLTVWQDGRPVYRPTVHYAYLPTDAAMNSLHECRMQGYRLQTEHRIMNDEITDGMDELGVLLLGHDLGGWWVGSQLDIHEARALVPHQNATTLQVAASVLAAVFWMIRHPAEGLCWPDHLDHREVLGVANPYLGPCPSVRTDWTPRQEGTDLFARFRPRREGDEAWAFRNFLVT